LLVTDVIGTGDMDAPASSRRRRRIPPWLTWLVAGVVVAGIVVVPYARSKLADSSATWLQHEWADRSAYDDARAVVIEDVDNRAGALDDHVVERAAAVADREEAAALTAMRRRLSARRMWAGDVSRARDAAAAALRLEVTTLRHDADAEHPAAYIYAPAVDRLVAVASARITSMARHRHLPPPRLVAVKLPPAHSALGELQHPTDFPTGLSVVIAENNRPTLFALDTGAVTKLPRPGDFGTTFWSGRIVLPTPTGVHLIDVHGRTRAVLSHIAAEPLSSGGATLWLRSARGVRRFDASGHPLTGWLRLPSPWYAVGAADRFVLLAHVVDEATVEEQLWDPATAERRRLPRTCFGGWLAGRNRLVAQPCEGDRTVTTIDLATARPRRLGLPAPVSSGADAVFDVLSPSGDEIALTVDGSAGEQAVLVDLRSGRVTPSPLDIPLPPAAWSADGKWVLLADQGSFTPGGPAQIALWRPRDGRITSVRLPVGTPLMQGMQLLTTNGG
jgi:hypothetical protein